MTDHLRGVTDMQIVATTPTKAVDVPIREVPRVPFTTDSAAPAKATEPSTPVDKLTADERKQLANCEQVIGKNIVAIGDALRIIREERLYRETHKAFAAYLKDRWGFTPQRAQQFINAADTHRVLVAEVGEDAMKGLSSEANLRVLRTVIKDEGLDAAKAVAVEAVKTAKPASVVAKKRTPAKRTPAKPAAVEPKPEPKAIEPAPADPVTEDVGSDTVADPIATIKEHLNIAFDLIDDLPPATAMTKDDYQGLALGLARYTDKVQNLYLPYIKAQAEARREAEAGAA
jgi:hypothetical protein